MPESKRYEESQKEQLKSESAEEFDTKDGKVNSNVDSNADKEKGNDIVDEVPAVRHKAPFTGVLDAFL